MKFFKSEIIELYKTYFENMRVKDFEKLEEIPEGVSVPEMQNLAAFIKNIKEANLETDLSNYKIGELVDNFVYVNYHELRDSL